MLLFIEKKVTQWRHGEKTPITILQFCKQFISFIYV